MKNQLHIYLTFLSLLGIFLLLNSFLSLAQDENLLVVETVVLQTDREIYLPGEKIWFKADYLIDGQKANNGMSKVLYVELFNEQKEPLYRNKFVIHAGLAQGMLPVPEGIPTANYIIRAYTQYMRNFDHETWSTNIVTIINPLIPLKEIDTNGQWNIKARVIEQGNQKKLALLFNPHLSAKINTAYVVSSDYEDSTKLSILSNGLASANFDSIGEEKPLLICMMESSDTIIKKLQVRKSKLAEPYVLDQSIADINITTSKKTYQTRELVELVLDNKAFRSDESYSISVVNKYASKSKKEDLPIYIVDNPGLLKSFLMLNPATTSLLEQIGLLMALSDLETLEEDEKVQTPLNEKNLQWYPESRAVNLMGVVRGKSSKNPVANVDVLLSVLDDYPMLHIFTTDEHGVFWFNLKHTEGLVNLYLSVRNSNMEEEVEILINNDFSNDFPQMELGQPLIDTSLKRNIEQMLVNTQVNQMFPKEDSIKKGKGHPIRFSEPGVSIRLEKFVDMKTLESVFDELVPFVKVRKQKGEYKLDVLDEKTNLIYGDPLILIDNLPVFNVGEMLQIHPSRIEQIDVINSTYIYGDHILKGIVLITTNTDNFGDMQLPESFTTLEFQSVANERIAAMPSYTSDEQLQNREPDFRSMLYWNPNFDPEKADGKISFYSSDQTGEYEVVIRGMLDKSLKSFGSVSFVISR